MILALAILDGCASGSLPSSAEDTNSGAPDTSETAEACVESTWYQDADDDGYGEPTDATTACAAPPGYVRSDDDCDDTDAKRNPGMHEDCSPGNTIDANCDGFVECHAFGAVWTLTDTNPLGYSSDIGDIDQDGRDDFALFSRHGEKYDNAWYDASVVVAADVPVGDSDLGAVRRAWRPGDEYSGFWIGVGLTDLDGDGTPEVAGHGWDSADGGLSIWSGGDLMLSGEFSFADASHWMRDTDGSYPGVGGTSDVDGDGEQELVLVSGLGGHQYAAYMPFGQLPTAVGPRDARHEVEGAGQNYDPSGNCDGDGLDDLVIDFGLSTVVISGATISSSGSVTEADADATVGEPVSPPRWGGDVDADGVDELLVRTGQGLVLVPGEEIQGTFLASGSTRVEWTDPETPIFGTRVPDLDGDGRGELSVSACGTGWACIPTTTKIALYSGATLSAGGTFGVEDADWVVYGSSGLSTLANADKPFGDVTGDGIPDLMLEDEEAGEVYLFSGADILP